MDFRRTDEQELLIRNLDELLNRVAPESEIARLDNAHEFPWEMWRKVCDAGFGGLGIPEEYGGTPADTLTMCIVEEEMKRHGTQLPFTMNWMMQENIIHFGNDKQKKELLPRMMNGDIYIAMGITEPQGGSDLAAIKTSYKKVDGGYVINGQKMYNTGVTLASHDMLVVRDPDVADPHKAMTMFLIDLTTPGIQLSPLQKVGCWGEPTCQVFFDDMLVPEDALFGVPHEGFIQLMKNMERERLVMCAGSLGMAQAAFEDACRYANKREQFGQPIGKFQLIQEKIAYMAIKIENMRNMTYKTAWKIDQGIPVRADTALAKLYCTQSTFEVCDDAMQVFGGVGYMMDNRVQRLWRDVRYYRIAGGTDQLMIVAAAPQILKQYREKVAEKA